MQKRWEKQAWASLLAAFISRVLVESSMGWMGCRMFAQGIHFLVSAGRGWMINTQDSMALFSIYYSSLGHQSTPQMMWLQAAAALLSFETISHAALFYYCILFIFLYFPEQQSLRCLCTNLRPHFWCIGSRPKGNSSLYLDGCPSLQDIDGLGQDGNSGKETASSLQIVPAMDISHIASDTKPS